MGLKKRDRQLQREMMDLTKYSVAPIGILLFLAACNMESAPHRTADGPVSILDHNVDSVLSLMTLQEKAGQLCIYGSNEKNLKKLIKKGWVGGTNGMLPGKADVYGYLDELQHLAMQSPVKIPLLFMGDVIHGYRTTFPVNLAQSCSWNPELIGKADSVSALEATADGMNWTFAPMVDISHDPRWGRVVEGAGEDPFLASVLATAAVKGFQGADLSGPRTLAATAKHFAAYGAVEAGRDYNTVNTSDRELWELYLPPFKAAVDAGIAAIMPAFISLNGVPASENSFLLEGILRRQLGFTGLVVSDYDAIPELLNHRVVATTEEAAAHAIEAGMDMDLHSGTYLESLPELVKAGKVKESTLDSAVRKVLALKFKLGLFAHPFQYGKRSGHNQKMLLKTHRLLARKVGRQSIVLLKNDSLPEQKTPVLPLSKNIHALAIIGPLAKDQKNILGPVHALGRPEEAISVWQGITEAVSPQTKLLYAKGTGIRTEDTTGFAAAVDAAGQADAVVMVVGEAAGMSGEGDSRSRLDLPGNQLALVKAVLKTGKPVIVLLMNGRPLAVPWLDSHVPAILETWLLGTETGHAIADVLFGDYNPSGKLTMTFPRNVGQVPLYYNHLNTGRPFVKGNKYTTRYVDVSNSPLYPFGYGLSYTTFSYSAIHLNTKKLVDNDTLMVSVRITNKGERPGTEIAQLYITDLIAGMSPRVKNLRGFKRVKLEPDETKTLTFYLEESDLRFYGKKGKFTAEPGVFKVFVGGNSATDNSATFTFTL